MYKITSIIQIYKRPHLLQKHIDAVMNQTIPSDKIIIIHNEGGCKFQYPQDVEIIYANPNRKYHMRFAIGLTLNTEYICFFDDDTIPANKWYENCIKTIDKHNCICTANGRDYIGSKSGPGKFKNFACGGNELDVNVDFGGHAWFVRKEHLKHMWRDDIHEYTNGEDIMLSANANIYAGIKTYIPPQPNSDPSLWGGMIGTCKMYGDDAVASYRINTSHIYDRLMLCKYYYNRGWMTKERVNENI